MASRKINSKEEKFITSAKEAALVDVPWIGRVSIWMTLVCIILALVWAHFAKLDEQTNAQGKVIPSTRNQVMQSLEGGILKTIYVTEGEVVEQGQPLLEIDNTQFLSELKEVKANQFNLKAEIARLEAENQYKAKIDFPPEVVDVPGLVEHETKLLFSKQSSYQNGLEEKIRNVESLKKEYDITNRLFMKGLMSELELIKIERSITQAKATVQEHKNSYKESVLTDLSTAKRQLAIVEERLVGLRDKVARTTINSPVRGQVKQLLITTIGGVISPGQDILELVPLNDKLLVEAKVKPADIGNLSPNQKAIVKITAYDFSIYGGLTGKLHYISADTIEGDDKNGESFYEIQVITDSNELITRNNERLPIIPGMTVSVHILTGKKSVLDYIFKPIKKGLSNALTER